jgi:hypothetical protein
MNDLNFMTPEELQEHIKKCQAILEAKQNEKVNELISNLASEAHRLLQERPWARVKAEYYDEEREETIEVYIELEYLTYEDNYEV